MVKNIRTIVIPQHDDQTYTTEWSYDTWNRLTEMTYADGETVSYQYNAGGLLQSMSGKKQADKYDYVTQLGYDKFEQRVLLSYGNGTKTTYSYEPKRRRLSNMTAKTAAGRAMMDNSYGYDAVNNILSLKNNAEVPGSNLMGGSSEYSYEYDDLYRLTSAAGKFTGSNHEHRYSLEMKYNSVGSILEKAQLHERKGSGDSWQQQKKTTYSQSYEYGDNQPHAPIHIGEQKYSYDKNGNQTGWTHDVSGQRRQIVWDSLSRIIGKENRIRAIADNGSVQHYIYDASGTRVLKGKSNGQSIFVNSEYKAGSGNMGNYTVYVNPYLVLRSGGYTKHYYIEGQRIVSKLGSGLDNNGKGQLKAGQDKVNYGSKQQQVREGIVKNLKFLGIDGAILTAGNSGKTPPGQLKGGKGGNAGGGKNKDAEKFQYFYHPDHLGSSSYITDASGEVYQHLEYFAFGETFVEEHSNTKHTPYLFNGKELDEETGLYYYGARYYDARTSIWLAVDPLAEEMPSWNPYSYVFNNPISFVDPDGRVPYPITVRAFAPFNYFGGGFHGDGAKRGFTTSSTATARVHQKIDFDTDKSIISAKAWSSSTSHRLVPGSLRETPSIEFADGAKVSSSGDAKTFSFGTHAAGSNPMVPGSPPIDIFSDFSITENKKAGTLSISGTLTGDNFPSTEAFISDPSGQSVFIAIGLYEGSPYSSLDGENKRDIGSFNFTITTDKKGNFAGVKMGDKSYSINEWNKLFELTNPHKSEQE